MSSSQFGRLAANIAGTINFHDDDMSGTIHRSNWSDLRRFRKVSHFAAF